MNKKLIKQLEEISESRQTKTDPSHDFQHIRRVTNLAIKIGKSVKADMDVVIPAALFHDTVIYRKDDPKSKNETDESAEITGNILNEIKEFPKDKIDRIKACIKECSFTKAPVPSSLESKVLQDADKLESTGAVSIMRTFSSGGLMQRGFYNPEDPFCKKGLDDTKMSGIWLFYKRLLVVEKRMHTPLAKKLAKRRTKFLKDFLNEFKKELVESDIKI